MSARCAVLYAEHDPLDAERTRAHFAEVAPEFALEIVHRADEFVARARTRRHAALLFDQRLRDMAALDVLKRLALEGIDTPLVLVAGPAEVDLGAEAQRLGANDYVLRTAGYHEHLPQHVRDAIERRRQTALARARVELAGRGGVQTPAGESDARLKVALEAGRVGLWFWEVDSGRMNFSPRWKAQIGYGEDEIGDAADEWYSRCHPEDLANLRGLMARYLASPWPEFSAEYRLKHKDGSWRCLLLQAALENDAGGRPLLMCGAQIDVTTLKQQQADMASTSARLQQLSRRLLNVQEAERRNLARELHDEIGQVLTVAKIHLQSMVLMPECGRFVPSLTEPVALLDRLLAQVRSLSLDLRPPLLDDLGLVPALHWLLQQHQSRASLPRVHLATDPDLTRFDPTLETACFRIAQEALTNALRHAQAGSVHLTLSVKDHTLRLRVRDDGVGFDAASARGRAERGGSLGLLGMHERALLAGGSLTLLSTPGDGTEIEAVFPLSISP